MRYPKGIPITPEMEAEYERAERLFTRARIIERGVATVLNTGDYLNLNELREAADVFTSAIGMRENAEIIRAAIRKAEQEANPKGAKVTVHRIRRRKTNEPA